MQQVRAKVMQDSRIPPHKKQQELMKMLRQYRYVGADAINEEEAGAPPYRPATPGVTRHGGLHPLLTLADALLASLGGGSAGGGGEQSRGGGGGGGGRS